MSNFDRNTGNPNGRTREATRNFNHENGVKSVNITKGATYIIATENWQKTIGGHSIWMSADVTINNSGKMPKFHIFMTLHAEDRYNFNPTNNDIATGIPDDENGQFSRAELAHQYTNFSTLSRHIRWDDLKIGVSYARSYDKLRYEQIRRARQPNK